jgi:hypothetical protein
MGVGRRGHIYVQYMYFILNIQEIIENLEVEECIYCIYARGERKRSYRYKTSGCSAGG